MADDLAPSAKVMKALLGKLYMILMGGDATAPASTDSFIAWLAPGIPIDPDNFTFAKKGTAGSTADESRSLLAQAADFARLVNLVPDASGVIDLKTQQATFENKGDMLWAAYGAALETSTVADGELTEDQKAKIEKFRKLLRKEKRSIVTDEVVGVEDGPVLVAYNEKWAAADAAALAYNNKRISAMNSDTARDVQDFALNADIYRSQVRAAEAAWVSGGYKNDVNEINAYIDQVTRRSLTLLKAGLLDQFKRGVMTDLISNGNFYITTPIPAGFATGSGWTEFTFKQENQGKYDRSETNTWEASLKVNAGLFGASAGSTGEISQATTSLDTKGFESSFEIIQVPISRPWFAPEFLKLKSWKWADPSKTAISDGKRPPTGSLIGYPTTCVFVRKLKMNFDELHNKDSKYAQNIKANVQTSYGPFVAATANYNRSVKENKFSSEITKDGLIVNGMQLIAMKCQLLPKAPDPDPNIKKWV